MTQSSEEKESPAESVASDPGRDPASATARLRWLKSKAALTVVAVVAVLLAYGIGASGTAGVQRRLNRANVTLARTQARLAAVSSRLDSTRTQLQSAQASAQNAMTTATARVKAQYAARMASVRQDQQSLARQDQALKTELGQLQRTSISADGVYVVGSDIKPGIYHTNGDGGQTGFQCYYATLGSTNTSNILDNNNFDGPETVDVSGAYAFQISGPCTWYRAG
jgi:hypothetical protein